MRLSTVFLCLFALSGNGCLPAWQHLPEHFTRGNPTKIPALESAKSCKQSSTCYAILRNDNQTPLFLAYRTAGNEESVVLSAAIEPRTLVALPLQTTAVETFFTQAPASWPVWSPRLVIILSAIDLQDKFPNIMLF